MDSIVGTRVGIFDVISQCDYRAADNHTLFHVKCSVCGWESDMTKAHIKAPKSCRHLRMDGTYIGTHTWLNSRLHATYNSMIKRCYHNDDKSFRFYGAKGIDVCDEWRTNSAAFEKWALESGYNDELTIDRIDPSLGYSPDNCRWVSMEENAKYKSTSNIIECDGMKYTGNELSRYLHVGQNCINRMLRTYTRDDVERFVISRRNDHEQSKSSNRGYMYDYNIR